MEDNEHGVKIFSEDNKNNNPCRVPQKSKIFRGPRLKPSLVSGFRRRGTVSRLSGDFVD